MANVLWTSGLYGYYDPHITSGVDGIYKIKKATSQELTLSFEMSGPDEIDPNLNGATVVIIGQGLSSNLNSGTITSVTFYDGRGRMAGSFDEMKLDFKIFWEGFTWADNDNPFFPSMLSGDDIVMGTTKGETLHGDEGNDRIYGGSGDDLLLGWTGNDTLESGSGNDRLFGDAGDDELRGSSGNDRFEGGRGADRLYGGSGADVFVFEYRSESTVAAKGRDTIFGFRSAQQDKIDVSAIDANTRSAGDQAFRFIGDDAFHKKAGELRYEKIAGDTFLYADANGDGKADFSIVIDAIIDLKASDFIL